MRKLILFAMVIGLLVILGGCATYTWRHPGYTPEKWSKERYECERDARQSGYFGTGITGAINMQNFFERCLESKGWVKTKNQPQTASIPPEERKPSPVDGVQTYYMSLTPDQKNKLIEEYMAAKKLNNNLLWPEFLKSKMEGSSYGSGSGYHWEKGENGNPVYVPHK